MTNPRIDMIEVGRAVGAFALIGAILGLAAYILHGLTNQPTSSGEVWLYVLGGAAIIVLWASAEWLLGRLGDVASWRHRENPTWKRVIAYTFIGAVLALLLFFAPIVNWLSGAT